MKVKTILIAAATTALVFFSAQASALSWAHGYVCTAAYTAQNNVWFGSDGYVTVSLYNAANCQGGYVGTYRYLSSGASNQGYQFTEAERRALYASMQRAAYNAARVSLFVSDDFGVFHTTVRSY